jgi:hypothetical protein
LAAQSTVLHFSVINPWICMFEPRYAY